MMTFMMKSWVPFQGPTVSSSGGVCWMTVAMTIFHSFNTTSISSKLDSCCCGHSGGATLCISFHCVCFQIHCLHQEPGICNSVNALKVHSSKIHPSALQHTIDDWRVEDILFCLLLTLQSSATHALSARRILKLSKSLS